MQNNKVQANSYSQQAYDYILRKIYTGEYPQGMRLKDKHLADEMGIEALLGKRIEVISMVL